MTVLAFDRSEPAPAHATRIVLCMIVKNEARIIERCLSAALPLVDGYVVCDTGSSDATAALIVQSGEQHGKPGCIVRHDWRDFGYNRTLSAAAARAWVSEQGWPLERTYLLLLDADMVLEGASGFDKNRLEAGCYHLTQDDGTLKYKNLRLACLAHEWHAVGPTHEYWQTSDAAVRAGALDEMWIRDIGDGGSKGDKIGRDVRLLRQALVREPDNPRHVFYLAQSYFDAGHWLEAARWYARRWMLGGWAEERWYALYRQGLCLLRLGDGARGPGLLLEAFDERPTRAEPLCALARYYRERGRNKAALMLALRALDIPFPADDVLFVERQVYEWQLWEEIMINAYYEPKQRELGFRSCERLSARRGHPPQFYDYVAGNTTFYLPRLPVQRAGTFTIPSDLSSKDGVDYNPANPTLVNLDGRTYVNVRLLNYRQEGGRSYGSPGDGIIRTRNVTLDWNPATGQAQGARESRGVPDSWPSSTRIRGLEDMRWVVHEGHVWFTATCFQVPDMPGRCCVVLGRMNPSLDAVEHVTLLRYAAAREVEKNWLLWSCAGRLLAIYAYDPLTLLVVDPESGRAEPLEPTTPAFYAGRYRGAAAPVAIRERPGRWLALVHEVVHRREGNVYSHRWIELDERAGLVGRSDPFVFDHVGIEYAAGLIEAEDGSFIVSFGFEDREARWVAIERSAVLGSICGAE
ncbi:MAG TPA: hypothetical protein VMG12_01840 [Polyangiaceae bacterium]|nr:hypothetical protein [Polyangiaceae bacterium]